jgi:hypothetical protein
VKDIRGIRSPWIKEELGWRYVGDMEERRGGGGWEMEKHRGDGGGMEEQRNGGAVTSAIEGEAKKKEAEN